MLPDFTEMDWVRAAILNAYVEGLSVEDLLAMAEHAETPAKFDEAVNILVGM